MKTARESLLEKLEVLVGLQQKEIEIDEYEESVFSDWAEGKSYLMTGRLSSLPKPNVMVMDVGGKLVRL